MAGLRKLCKLYGSLVVKDEKGAAVRYVWDYASDKPTREEEMPFGSERHAASERAKWLQHPPRNRLQCAARGCDGCAVCAPPASPAPGTP